MANVLFTLLRRQGRSSDLKRWSGRLGRMMLWGPSQPDSVTDIDRVKAHSVTVKPNPQLGELTAEPSRRSIDEARVPLVLAAPPTGAKSIPARLGTTSAGCSPQ